MIRLNATVVHVGNANRFLPHVRCCTTISSSSSPHAAAVARADVRIELPKKKKRDELSILRALAGTVSFDATGPRHWFIDDPVLMPRSRVQQRIFAFSRASGRKAARYLLNQYDRKFGVFTQDEPHIETLTPSPFLAAAEKQDEDGLNALIELRQINAAHRLYLQLVKQETSLSMKTQLRLLDALCAFGNDLEAGERDYRLEPEERWYMQELMQLRSGRKDQDVMSLLTRWQQDGPAEQLFLRILDQLKLTSVTSNENHSNSSDSHVTAKSSSDDDGTSSAKLDASSQQALTSALQAMIRGASKYGSAPRAFELLDVCQRYSVVPDLATYNAAVDVIARSRFDNSQRIEKMMNLLKQMKNNGVKPTQETFNAVLHVISSIRMASEQARALASKTLREMQLLGIQPSLASWTHVINVFYPTSASRSTIIYGIIERLENEARRTGEPFRVREPADLEFFSVAMQRCVTCTHDPTLAFRIDKLLQSNGNAALIGNGHKELRYTASMFQLLLAAETIETVMDFYEQRVPHAWQPSRTTYHGLLDTIDIYKAYRYLPRIWNDVADGIERGATEFDADLVRRMLKSVTQNRHEVALQASWLKWVMQLRAFVDFEKTKRAYDKTRGRLSNRQGIDTDICSSAIIVALRADDFELARFFFLEYRELSTAKGDTATKQNALSDDAYAELVILRKRLPEMDKQKDRVEAVKKARSLLDSVIDPVDSQALERIQRKLAVAGTRPRGGEPESARKARTGQVKPATRDPVGEVA